MTRRRLTGRWNGSYDGESEEKKKTAAGRKMKMEIKKKRYLGVALAMALLLAGVALRSSFHDLSGTYNTCETFLVDAITFRRDGTFTAYNGYEELEGKYSKNGGRYSLRFTDGRSTSGEPVSNFRAALSVSEYGLEAEKISDSQLRVYVTADISFAGYWAWDGEYADFTRNW